MVEMKSGISGILSSCLAAIGSRVTVRPTEIVAPPMRISVKKNWSNGWLRRARCGPENPPQCSGQL